MRTANRTAAKYHFLRSTKEVYPFLYSRVLIFPSAVCYTCLCSFQFLVFTLHYAFSNLCLKVVDLPSFRSVAFLGLKLRFLLGLAWFVGEPNCLSVIYYLLSMILWSVLFSFEETTSYNSWHVFLFSPIMFCSFT